MATTVINYLQEPNRKVIKSMIFNSKSSIPPFPSIGSVFIDGQEYWLPNGNVETHIDEKNMLTTVTINFLVEKR